MEVTRTVEPQYDYVLDEEPVTLGPMTSSTWRRDPKHLLFVLSRYKFVATRLRGYGSVAEIGCGDAFGSALVEREVEELDLYDIDGVWGEYARNCSSFDVCDITKSPLPLGYEAIYMIDVLEHIHKMDEAISNVCKSLTADGVFISGSPSLESQKYASDISKKGHVSCQNGYYLDNFFGKYFHNVFMFSMNDEVVHTGYMPMAHYLFALCVGPK